MQCYLAFITDIEDEVAPQKPDVMDNTPARL
jgi:hypothetical protein